MRMIPTDWRHCCESCARDDVIAAEWGEVGRERGDLNYLVGWVGVLCVA